MVRIDIGGAFEALVQWLQTNFEPFFSAVSAVIGATIAGLEQALLLLPSSVMIPLVALLAWRVASRSVAAFTLVGFTLLSVPKRMGVCARHFVSRKLEEGANRTASGLQEDSHRTAR